MKYSALKKGDQLTIVTAHGRRYPSVITRVNFRKEMRLTKLSPTIKPMCYEYLSEGKKYITQRPEGHINPDHYILVRDGKILLK